VRAKVKASRIERDRGTEQRILDAANAVFLRRGTAGARMEEIAREADVNQALLHYYFRTKDRLAEAVFRRAAQQLLPSLIEILSSPIDLEQKVARVVQLELDHLLRTPNLPGYLLSELHHNPERARQFISAITGIVPEEARPKVLTALRQQIEERVQAGTMVPIAPEQFVVNLISLCIFPFAARPMLLVLLGVDQAGFTRFIEERRRQLVPFFLRALRP
jgi:TetR/AcrR family transcriptional regulator